MKKDRNRNGFSMIEVLVASAILVVIVMMLGMLFKQTSLAWRTGVKRADGYIQLRAILGAIQRDASSAVDASAIPKDLRDKLGGNQQFSGTLQFYTLTGTNRALTYVTYAVSGSTCTRQETVLTAEGGISTGPSVDMGNVTERTDNPNKATTTIGAITPQYGSLNSGNGLPLYLTVDATVTTVGQALDIGASSDGPDGVPGTKDDIRTWTE